MSGLEKWAEVASKILNPYLTRKQADADAYADNKKIETIHNNPDMLISYENGLANIHLCSPKELSVRAEARKIMEATRQQENLEKVLCQSKNYLHSDVEVSDTPVDEDWRVRFTNIVQDVSSEEMQNIWAKILADEVVTPGTFSLRTLDVVRNISKEEARLFEKLLHVAIIERSTVFILSNNDMLKRYGINYIDIQRLSESGLINSNYGANYSFEISGNTQRGLCGRDNIIVIVNNHDENVKISLPVYRFTTAGEQLLKCLRFTSKAEYFVECAEIIYKQNNALTVSAHDLITQNGENIIYNPAPIKKFG